MVSKNKISILLTIILSLLIVYASRGLFQRQYVTVSLQMTSSAPAAHRLYWSADGKDYKSASSKSFQSRLKDTEELIVIKVPASQIRKMQLNLNDGGLKAGYSISSLKINGTDYLKDIRYHNLAQEGNLMTVKGTNPNLSLSFSEKSPVKAVSHTDWLPMTALFLIFSILIYSFLSKLLLPLYLSAPQKGQVLFLCLIGLILTLPLFRTHVFQTKSVEENRNLAVPPPISGGLNSQFGKQFEAWFNDRFGGRKYFIRLHDRVEHILAFGNIENEKAFLGKDRWLFYKGDHSMDLYQNRLPFSDAQKALIQNNLAREKTYLAGHNADYYVFVAPNKADVYGEFYKPGLHKVNQEDRTLLLQKYLSSHQSPVQIIYPLHELLRHKSDGLMYMKTDTHWSEAGAYIGYLELMKEIRKNHPDIFVLDPSDMKMEQIRHPTGDLTGMLAINDKHWYDDDIYQKPVPKEGFHYKVVEDKKIHGNTDSIIRTKNPLRKGKVFIFRDSFTSSLIPYISESFGEVVYLWTHDLNKETNHKFMEQEKPDIVIHEMVSRYVQSLLQEPTNWKEGK